MYHQFKLAADFLFLPLLSVVLIVTTAAAQMEDTNDISRVLDNSKELKNPMNSEMIGFADNYDERRPEDTESIKALLESLKMTKHQNPRESQENDNALTEKEKRPFCNGFHGCGIVKGKRPAGILLRSLQPIPEKPEERLKRPFCNGFFGCGNGKRSRKLLLNLSSLRPLSGNLPSRGLHLTQMVDLQYPFFKAPSFINTGQPVSLNTGNFRYHRPYTNKDEYIIGKVNYMPAQTPFEIIKPFSVQGKNDDGPHNHVPLIKETISPQSSLNDEYFGANHNPKAADELVMEESALSPQYDIDDTNEIRYHDDLDAESKVSSAEITSGTKKIYKRLIFCPDEGCMNKRVYMLPSHVGRKMAKRALKARNEERLPVDADRSGNTLEGRLYSFGDKEGIDVLQYVMNDGQIKMCSANNACFDGDVTEKEVQPNSNTYFYCGKKYVCFFGKIALCRGGNKVGSNIFRSIYASKRQCGLNTDVEKRLITNRYGYANVFKTSKGKTDKAKKYVQKW